MKAKKAQNGEITSVRCLSETWNPTPASQRDLGLPVC